MTLQEQLDAHKARSRERIPKETQEILQRAVQEVRNSGILDRTLKVGDRVPDFTLPNIAGQPVSLKGLVAGGP